MEFELSETHRMFKQTMRDFADNEVRPIAEEIDRKEFYPYEIYDRLAELGLAGAAFPEKYGGSDGDWLMLILAMEELSRVSLGVSMAQGWALYAPPVYLLGSEDQRMALLKPVIQGEKKGCFAMTEPDAGSDVNNVRTLARLDGDHYIVNGNKIFITNASVSDHMLTVARTRKERVGHQGLSLLIIDSNSPGITTRDLKKLGARGAPACEIAFEDVKVPSSRLVGEEGKGFYALTKVLALFRSLFGVLGVGVAQGAFDEAIQYARQRVQFGKPISKFQAIQGMLANMYAEIESARLMIYRSTWLFDQGLPCEKESAAAKLIASEVAKRTADKALYIFGGYGYMMETPIQRYFRDAKLIEIGEGTSEIQRMVIAKQLGL